MKKIITSVIVLSCMAVPAFAQQHKMKHAARNCPAKTCTDHSYDQAYSAPQGSNYAWTDVAEKKNCPAATCTDHSYDKAYSAGQNTSTTTRSTYVSNRKMTIPVVRNNDAWTPAPTQTRDDAYSMNDYTYYGRQYKTNPNPYQGDDAPSYDGPAKNKYRNMRANNDSEPLPSSTGR